MNYKVSQMFVITYLLLFCFFTALCTNATKNANERACEMPSLAKTPGLQQNTQTLLPRLAIRLGWLGSRIRLAFHHWFGPHLGACRKTVNQEESKLGTMPSYKLNQFTGASNLFAKFSKLPSKSLKTFT
ncbi:hypothetical protein L596_007391 [Steinernema carpocapsae]|uniref:Uncharacterized protein n=1 Tax=Steinernema carpocapsae TaxID=34508 RepID=A0A4U5P949_STECR|nr:hypothetical protein L596_007391 [Steinernema carpocapsae]